MAEASIQNVIAQFQTAVSSGQNWYLALLAAARDWPEAEEELNGARYRYLIAGEALDLNQVAERLIEASRELIPGEEQLDLLFRGKPPVAFSPEEMKKYLGEEKAGWTAAGAGLAACTPGAAAGLAACVPGLP